MSTYNIHFKEEKSKTISKLSSNTHFICSDIYAKLSINYYMSHVVRKPVFCKCKNKDADQLRGNREADQRLCFCHMDSKIPLLSKSEISSL